MPTVTLTNPGLIPMEAVTTLGINVKEGDNPIGFFGTGLKYAIASLLRTGQQITIFRGLEKYEFTTKEIEVRGKVFKFIFMNGERLGFTTDLGKTWEMWQVFRELYSNCLDEKGSMSLRSEAPAEDQTTIWVDGDAFFTAATKKKEIFLESKPLVSYEGVCELHEGATNAVYYRGIKVAELEKKSVYTYNILEAQTLTEDRTLKNTWQIPTYVINVILKAEEPDIIEKAVGNNASFEWDMNYAYYNISQVFAETVIGLAYKKGFASVSASALLAAESFMKKTAEIRRAVITRYEYLQLEKAKAFLLKIGFEVTEEIVVAVNLGQGIAGQARDGKIYLSKDTLDKGGNFLIGTILEEHLHITKGFMDESRGFQNYLLDLVVRFARETIKEEDF